MFFEAQLNGQIFQVGITESKDFWKIHILDISSGEKQTSKTYQINKCDFQKRGHIRRFLFENKSHIFHVLKDGTQYTVNRQGIIQNIIVYNDQMLLRQKLKGRDLVNNTSTLTANMPGKIIDIFVKANEKITTGQSLLVMESMKMENEIRSSFDAVIESIKVKKGNSVEVGDVLVVLKSDKP